MNNDYQLIDPAVLMEAAGDSEEGFLHLLEIFLRIVPEMTQRLDTAVASGDLAAQAREAHALKGCLALVGARDCAARTEALERGAKRGEQALDGAGWGALRTAIEGALAEARACHAAGGCQPCIRTQNN